MIGIFPVKLFNNFFTIQVLNIVDDMFGIGHLQAGLMEIRVKGFMI